jgi:putative membrane protein
LRTEARPRGMRAKVGSFSRATGAFCLFLTATASAHPLDASTPPAAALSTWSSELGVLLGLASLAIGYVVYGRRARARGEAPVSRWNVAAFVLGWLATAMALVSPLDAMGSVLFSAHMVQHEVLMIVAAPLLVLSVPWRTPEALRAHWAWSLHAAAVLVWHVPSLFDAAVHDDAVHAMQHLSFFGTALLFWWSVLRSAAGPAQRAYGVAVVSVFTTAVYTTLLGALLTVAPTAWYSAYASTTRPWGLSPLEDQQIGGLVMWVPAGLVYTAAGLWLFAAWLKRTDAPDLRAIASRSTLVLALAVGAACASACNRGDEYRAAAAMTGGDPSRGSEKLTDYGCETCHTIPGIRSARGLVGPPLTSIGARVYLAGRLPNTPDNMRKWIQHPHDVDDKTAMPETGVTDADARDIAAYLYTLR